MCAYAPSRRITSRPSSAPSRGGQQAINATAGRRPPQSGKVVARIGLRMMPTFPPPPLSFRTLGFPQYGWKAGLSDGAFPDRRSVKSAPGIPEPTASLRPPFVRLVAKPGTPALCRAGDSIAHRRGGWGCPPPQGPSLGSGFCCPRASSLIGPIRPTRRHIAISPSRLIRDAFAVRERLGDPRVVPGFRCSFLPGMPLSMTPGSSNIDHVQYLDADTGLRQDLNGSALPILPQSASRGARISGLPVSHLLRPARLLAPPWRIRPVIAGPRGLIHPGFRRLGRPRRRWTSLRQPLDSSVGGTFTRWNET